MNFSSLVPKKYPESLLANKALFPSRLSCENNIGVFNPRNVGKRSSQKFLLCLAALITQFFCGLLSQVSRTNSETKHESFIKSVDFLLLSHYVGPHQKYDLDPFLGAVATNIRTRFTTSTFFFNSTKASFREVESEIQQTLRHEFTVNHSKFRIRRLLLVIHQLFKDLNLVFRDKVENYSHPRVMSPSQFFVSQLSRSTISVLLAWENFSDTIFKLRPRFIVIPCEGNSHELLFVHRIKKHFPEIRILMYQHAPIVVDQPGFYRVVSNLRKEDALLLSSSHALTFVKQTIPSRELKCEIVNVGSSRKKQIHKIESRVRQERVKKTRNILVTPEGTHCALEEMLDAINHFRLKGFDGEIRIRLHPDSTPNRNVSKLLSIRARSGMISESSLEEDLIWADELWFRCSSVVDVAIQMNVLPVHVNLNPRYNLNPLRGLSQPFIEIRSLDDINELESNRDRVGNFSFSSKETDFVFQAFSTEVFTSFLKSLSRS